ncbi:MAG: hypothetical protein GXO50_08040, partial [Chlorobi bacterium]|nr:hypothetical protein [Chlorobiota bacterium]
QDENTLYFVSDMPGGFGGMDIYKSEKQNNGIWSRPENLGSSINTEGDEAFPFLNEGFLFFASDGHPGLGGLDIFAAKITDNEVIYIENLGSPVNSNYDDFAIYLDSSGIAGFFTSNRPGGKGSDDIYSVKFESKYFDKSDIIEQRFVEDIPDSVNLDKNNLVITYTIQLGAFKRKIPVTHNFFRDFKGKVELKTGRDSLNHYIYGRYKNKTDAEQQLTVFHEQGFYDAFIRELIWYNEEKLYKSNIIE